MPNSKRRLVSVAAFSGAINVMTLSGSIYMLQVYDRVLPSRSVTTLAGLSILLLGVYLLQGYINSVRTRMLARIAALFDTALQKPIYEALVNQRLKGAGSAAAMQPVRDLSLSAPSCPGWGRPPSWICLGRQFSRWRSSCSIH